MRDILFFILIFGSIPLILWRPWFGVIMWYWVGIMNPHRLAWGFLMHQPVAMGVGAATLLGLLLSKDRRPPPMTREVVLLTLFVLHFTVAAYFAWVPDVAWSLWEQRMKIILMTVVTLMLIWGKPRTMALLAILTLSIAFFGMKGGFHALSTGFGGMVLGPPASFIFGNTNIGLAMVMTLPLVLVLARQVHRGEFELPFKLALYDRWHRSMGLFLYGVFWLQIASIVGTHSRGAWVGLAVIFPLIFFGMKHKLAMIMAGVLAVGIVGVTVPDKIVEQYDTLVNYEEDASAQGRFEAWWVSWNIAVESPLMGTGFGTQHLEPRIWQTYSDQPEAPPDRRAAHSIYFQVLGEGGFVGFFLWAGMIGFSMLTMLRVRREARLRQDTFWMSEWATGLLLGLIGFLVSGAFLSLAYFDLFLAMVAAAIIMRRELDDHQEVRRTENLANASLARRRNGNALAHRPIHRPLSAIRQQKHHSA